MVFCYSSPNTLRQTFRNFFYTIYKGLGDFPGGTVVKNPPANAGHTGSIPGPGRYHMPRSN